MVDRAHRDAVRHNWLSSIAILSDMGSIQKRAMTEAAQSTLRPICREHSSPEDALVHSATYLRRRIFTTQGKVHRVIERLRPLFPHSLVNRDDKLLLLGFFPDHIHG